MQSTCGVDHVTAVQAGPSSSGPRAEGKRPVPVPQGAPPPFEGCRQFPERKMQTTSMLSCCSVDPCLCPYQARPCILFLTCKHDCNHESVVEHLANLNRHCMTVKFDLPAVCSCVHLLFI